MKAIQVKYLKPTEKGWSKWKAKAEGVKPVTLSTDENSARDCAEKLANLYGWLGNAELVEGNLPNGDFVFCILTKKGLIR